jgi:hypothetical protein
VDRVRIAGRGLFPAKDVRLEALELETDPIHVTTRATRRQKRKLEQPLRAGVRLVLKQEDINRALRSRSVSDQLRKLGISVLPERSARQVEHYDLLNPRIEFLANHRLRLRVNLREEGDPAILEIVAETGLEMVQGHQISFVQPIVHLNGKLVSDEVLTSFVNGSAERMDLRQLERSGILARILQLKVEAEQIELAAFMQVAAGQTF